MKSANIFLFKDMQTKLGDLNVGATIASTVVKLSTSNATESDTTSLMYVIDFRS